MVLTCKANPGALDNLYCARYLLALQPDFRRQVTALAETVEEAGHIFDLYPKFHCECNFIERYWGAVKRIAREQCDYSFKSLSENIAEYLDSIPIAMIRRFEQKAWRYIDAYSKGLTGRKAEKAVKKYKSHRRVFNLDDLTDEEPEEPEEAQS